jgi:hypothetical protein
MQSLKFYILVTIRKAHITSNQTDQEAFAFRDGASGALIRIIGLYFVRMSALSEVPSPFHRLCRLSAEFACFSGAPE